MEDFEKKRIRELEEIVGKASVEKYAFYDDVEYDNISIGIRVISLEERKEVIKIFREMTNVPMSELVTSLKNNDSYIYSISLIDPEGVLERWKEVRKIMKLKTTLESSGCKCSIDVWLPDSDFNRKDCDNSEIEYLETRIVTWM